MRTQREWMDEMEAAHDCKKCQGKIFTISKDILGNSCCAYCGKRVKYPNATLNELKNWMQNN